MQFISPILHTEKAKRAPKATRTVAKTAQIDRLHHKGTTEMNVFKQKAVIGGGIGVAFATGDAMKAVSVGFSLSY